jgi:hypothetical protein
MPIDVAEAVQVATNAVRVVLAGDVSIGNRGDVRDPLYDRAWTIDAPNEPGIRVPLVVWAEPADSQSVILYLDADLEGPGRIYRAIANVQLVGEDRPVAERSAEFRTFGESRRSAGKRSTKSFDLANRGSLSVEADGDYQTDAGLDTVRKRVARRLSTPKGAFAHLPGYGLRLPVKRTYSTGDLRTLQADALEQVLAEGVLDAQVYISQPEPGVVLVVVQGTGLEEGVTVERRRED